MDKDEYIEKIGKKINDTTLYEEVRNPTSKIKEKISGLTERLFQANRITQSMKYELTSIDDLPRVRGQPKLHKTNHPMRIVTCSRNTITSPVSRFGLTLIKQLRETIENTIYNTMKFVDQILGTKLDLNDRFASLDKEDLFRNISVTRAVDIAIGRIGASEKFVESSLIKTDLKQLLLLALTL